jgi:hypothetical protein
MTARRLLWSIAALAPLALVLHLATLRHRSLVALTVAAGLTTATGVVACIAPSLRAERAPAIASIVLGGAVLAFALATWVSLGRAVAWTLW